MIHAEKVNYWQTSRTSPATWLDRAGKQIAKVDGVLRRQGFIQEETGGAFLLAFDIGDDYFHIIWPILQPKGGNMAAARIQAATALYHEVKNATVKALFLGARTAFFAYLMLEDPNGCIRPISDMPTPELVEAISTPLMLRGP